MMSEQRDIRYDIIRAVAILFVVCIHSYPAIIGRDVNVYVNSFVNVCISTAVPLFVMLSGALLLGRKESISFTLRHRLKRILVPFLFWSVIVYFSFFFIRQGFSAPTTAVCLKGYVHDLVAMNIHPVYWFVYMMIGLYLLLPILRIVVQSGPKAFNYLLMFVFCGLVIGKCFPQSPFVTWWNNLYFTWVFLFLSGYWAATSRFTSSKAFRLISALSLVCLMALCVVLEVRQLNESVYDLVKLAYYVAGFCFLLSVLPKRGHHPAMTSCIVKMSRLSYGIYLSHILFVSLYIRLLSGMMMPRWLIFVCVIALVTVTSAIVLTFLKKIGLGKIVM